MSYNMYKGRSDAAPPVIAASPWIPFRRVTDGLTSTFVGHVRSEEAIPGTYISRTMHGRQVWEWTTRIFCHRCRAELGTRKRNTNVAATATSACSTATAASPSRRTSSG